MSVLATHSDRIKLALSNPEVRAKMSAASKRVWDDPEARAKLIAARGGYKKRRATCARCTAVFEKYNTKTSARDYCSVACQRADRLGERNPKWRGGTVIILNCKACSKPFEIQRAGTTRRRGQFCSRACKVKSNTIYATRQEGRREGGRRYETRKRAARKLDHHTKAEWVALLGAYGGKCLRCGATERIERDHIIPISKGGHDGISNIQPLCKRCNCIKHNKVAA